MDIVNPPSSEDEVSDQEDVIWKREEDFGKMDEKSMLNEMKPSNDLLYMYPSKARASISTKIENCSKISLMDKNMFPEGFSSCRPIDTTWKKHILGGKNTQAAMTQMTNKKQALIRLKSKEELLEKTEIYQSGTETYVTHHELKQLTAEATSTPLTISPPSNSKSDIRRGVSCIMWIHLQASICTEWAHERLVLKQGQQNAAQLKLSKENILKKSTFHQELDSLHELQTNSYKPGVSKAPRTIHRCILKTSSKTKDPKNSNLECHVCNTSYCNYNTYFTHLIDNTCMKYQEENRISNTRITIYAPLVENIISTQAAVSAPIQARKNLKSEEDMYRLQAGWLEIRENIGFDKKTGNTYFKQFDNKMEDTPAFIHMESDADPEVQIISEQMRDVNNEPTHKKIRLSEESTDTDKGDNCTMIKWEEETVSTENVENTTSYKVNHSTSPVTMATVSNDHLPNFDEKAASETLLLLSSSSLSQTDASVATEKFEINQEVPLTEPEVTSSASLFCLPVLCPCEAARRLDNITNEENSKDELKFADFAAKLTVVLTQLLGERRLDQLGFPATSGKEVLEKVLRLTGTTITREDDLCTETCKEKKDKDVQRDFRFLKSRLIALEMNTEAFLKICTPDEAIWEKFGWKGKKVDEIITQIVEMGLPTL